MTFRIRALAPIALVVLGSGAFAQTASTDPTPPSQEEMQAAMTSPQAFAERAASSNMFEIMSSQLALQVSQSEEVRGFAEHMIRDHSAAGEQMKVAAATEGLPPSDRLMPDHQAQLDSLAAIAPEEFDLAYLGAQLAAHTEAVTLFDGYATQGPEGALKDFAAQTLPVLQEHFAKVEPLTVR
jgi:putative membrane protein